MIIIFYTYILLYTTHTYIKGSKIKCDRLCCRHVYVYNCWSVFSSSSLCYSYCFGFVANIFWGKVYPPDWTTVVYDHLQACRPPTVESSWFIVVPNHLQKKKRFRTIEFNHEHTLAFIYIYYFKLYYKRSYTRSFSDAQNLLTGNVHSDRNETMKIPWPPCIKIYNVAIEDISTL